MAHIQVYVVVCISVCECLCMCPHECVGQMLNVNQSPPQSPSTLLFETAGLGVVFHWICRPTVRLKSWPMNSRDPPCVHPLPQHCDDRHTFYPGAGYPNTGPHVCMADILLTELSPWIHTFWNVWSIPRSGSGICMDTLWETRPTFCSTWTPCRLQYTLKKSTRTWGQILPETKDPWPHLLEANEFLSQRSINLF